MKIAFSLKQYFIPKKVIKALSLLIYMVELHFKNNIKTWHVIFLILNDIHIAFGT